jgi:hypothetical protein
MNVMNRSGPDDRFLKYGLRTKGYQVATRRNGDGTHRIYVCKPLDDAS